MHIKTIILSAFGLLITTLSPAFAANQGVTSVDTIAQMESKCPVAYTAFYVKGVGLYRWDSTSTATPDTADSPQSIVQCTGITTGRMVLDTGGIVEPTIAAMEGIPDPLAGMAVTVSGAQGGLFNWLPCGGTGQPSCTADGGTTFDSTISGAPAGYNWQRQYSGPDVYMDWWGISTTDGVANLAALNSAIALIQYGGILHYPKGNGNYPITGTLTFTNGMTFVVKGAGIYDCLKETSNAALFHFEAGSHITLKDVCGVGTGNTGTSTSQDGVDLDSDTQDFHITNAYFGDLNGKCVYSEGAYNGDLKNIRCYNYGKAANGFDLEPNVSNVPGSGITVDDDQAIISTADGTGVGFKIINQGQISGHNLFASGNAKNFDIENNIASTYGALLSEFATGVHGFVFDNNQASSVHGINESVGAEITGNQGGIFTGTVAASSGVNFTYSNNKFSYADLSGTWTVTPGAGQTLSVANGTWRRINDEVYVTFYAIYNTVTANTTTVTLGGLPFTDFNSSYAVQGGTAFFQSGFTSVSGPITYTVNAGTSTIKLQQITSGTSVDLTNNNLAYNANIAGSFTYRTNE